MVSANYCLGLGQEAVEPQGVLGLVLAHWKVWTNLRVACLGAQHVLELMSDSCSKGLGVG